MEFTVPLSIHLATEHADIGSLERAVTHGVAEAGQALWAVLIERLEVTLPRPISCGACGGRLVASGRAPRRLITLVGEVELGRQRFRCNRLRARDRPTRRRARPRAPGPAHPRGPRAGPVAGHRDELPAGGRCGREEAGQDLDRSAKLVAVHGYVSSNHSAIENDRIAPLASSEPIEKAVDLVVARRFKARGMSWFRRGFSALVRLRLLRLNGTWAGYWAERFATSLRPWPSSA